MDSRVRVQCRFHIIIPKFVNYAAMMAKWTVGWLRIKIASLIRLLTLSIECKVQLPEMLPLIERVTTRTNTALAVIYDTVRKERAGLECLATVRKSTSEKVFIQKKSEAYMLYRSLHFARAIVTIVNAEWRDGFFTVPSLVEMQSVKVQVEEL